MKTYLACAIALAAGSSAVAQTLNQHMNMIRKDFKKVYVISDPKVIYAPFDVEYFTVATSMAHQASVDEAAAARGANPYFTSGLKSFDIEAARELYDYYADSVLWARYDWREAKIALDVNLQMVGLGWVQTIS